MPGAALPPGAHPAAEDNVPLVYNEPVPLDRNPPAVEMATGLPAQPTPLATPEYVETPTDKPAAPPDVCVPAPGKYAPPPTEPLPPGAPALPPKLPLAPPPPAATASTAPLVVATPVAAPPPQPATAAAAVVTVNDEPPDAQKDAANSAPAPAASPKAFVWPVEPEPPASSAVT